MNRTKELGTESIIKLLIKYSIPSIIAMIVNAVYNVVDRVFIGQYAGEDALAGLTIAFPLMLIMFAFASLIGIGGAALLSINLGKKDMKMANHVFSNTISWGIIVNAGILVILYFNMKSLLYIAGATPDIINYASSYLTIILYGFIFQMFSFILNSFVRTEGHPQLSMAAMLSSAGMNIVLDYIFVARMGMGVQGAAYATVLGQFVGLIILLTFYFRRKSVFTLHKKDILPDVKIGLKIVEIGFATFVSTLGASAATMLLNNSLVLYGGVAAVTAMGAINSLYTFFIMPMNGLNQGMQPIIGYNKGAEQLERVYRTLKYALIASVIFSTVVFAAYELFPATFISLFINSSSDTMPVAVQGLRIYFLSLPLLSINVIGISFFQGIAEGKLSFLLGTLRQFVLFIPLVMILPQMFGIAGTWAVTPIADGIAIVITGIVIVRYYKKDSSKRKKAELAGMTENPEL